MKASYKAYFFFIRAFHDACYGVFLNLNGSQPGAYSSMSRCIKKKVTPAFHQVDSISGYVDWFKKFKQKRDIIKQGVGFSLRGPQWDVGVGFNSYTPEGGVVVRLDEDGFHLADLIQAFQYSYRLVNLIQQSIPNTDPKSKREPV